MPRPIPLPLADAINYPLLCALGLTAFLLLTLAVTLIESFVFRLVLRAPIRQTYGRLLFANLLSTLAGAAMAYFQDAFYDAFSVRTIPSRYAHAIQISIAMIVACYIASIVVESLVVATRSFAARLHRSRRALLFTVILANTASYLLPSPILFFLEPGSTPANLDLCEDTTWTTHPDLVVYFIDRKDHFLKRVRLDGQGLATLVPQPCSDYRISANGEVLDYRTPDGQLHNLLADHPQPQSSPASQPTTSPDDARRLVYARRQWSFSDSTPACTASYDFRFNPQMHIYRGKQTLHIPDEFGGLGCPTILPGDSEILIAWWGQTYLLDLDHRRLGFVADGDHYTLMLPPFQLTSAGK